MATDELVELGMKEVCLERGRGERRDGRRGGGGRGKYEVEGEEGERESDDWMERNRREGGLPVGGIRCAESHRLVDQACELGLGIAFAQSGDDLLQSMADTPLLAGRVLEEMGQ